MTFHILGRIIPTDFHHVFQRGRAQPPSRIAKLVQRPRITTVYHDCSNPLYVNYSHLIKGNWSFNHFINQVPPLVNMGCWEQPCIVELYGRYVEVVHGVNR